VLDIIWTYGRLLLLGGYPRGPLGGLAMTLVLSACCLALTFPLATGVALARASRRPAQVRACVAYLYAVRAMPLLLLIFWVYYVLPFATGITLNPFVTMLISLTVFQSAYLSEVIRAAVEALPRGQRDAAAALGLGYWVTTFRVVLPQALVNCIPGILNQFVLLIKETALGYVITFNEITYSANQLNNILLVKPIEIFAVLALSYFVVCSGLSRCSVLLERRLSLHAARTPMPAPRAGLRFRALLGRTRQACSPQGEN